MIAWVAEHAGFTYSLHSPSGDGESCVPSSSGMSTPETFAAQFNCGADDVYELNRTDVYWSGYYISPPRLQRNLFTTPYLSNVGISLVMQQGKLDLGKAAKRIINPFSEQMWLLFALVASGFTFIMWLINDGASATKYADMLASSRPELFSTKTRPGYCVMEQWKATFPYYAASTFSQVISDPAAFSPNTVSASAFYACFALFAFIFNSVYTAKLTADLTVLQSTLPVSGLDMVGQAQAEGKMGAVCVLAATAYGAWMMKTFPDMELIEVVGTQEDMIAAMVLGRCEGVVNVYPDSYYSVQRIQNCGDKLELVGAPLRFGPQDMAVGVRSDLSQVHVALSYWIQVFRSCDRNDAGPCYNRINMQGLFSKWYSGPGCAYTDREGLGPEAFFYPFILLGVAGTAVVIAELCSARMRHRLTVFRRRWSKKPHGLAHILEVVTKKHTSCVLANGMVNASQLQQSFRASFLRQGGEDHAMLVKELKLHYVMEDMDAWHLLQATQHALRVERQLMEQAGLKLDESTSDGNTNVTQSIHLETDDSESVESEADHTLEGADALLMRRISALLDEQGALLVRALERLGRVTLESQELVLRKFGSEAARIAFMGRIVSHSASLVAHSVHSAHSAHSHKSIDIAQPLGQASSL
jgi:hypothetical protein